MGFDYLVMGLNLSVIHQQRLVQVVLHLFLLSKVSGLSPMNGKKLYDWRALPLIELTVARL